MLCSLFGACWQLALTSLCSFLFFLFVFVYSLLLFLIALTTICSRLALLFFSSINPVHPAECGRCDTGRWQWRAYGTRTRSSHKLRRASASYTGTALSCCCRCCSGSARRRLPTAVCCAPAAASHARRCIRCCSERRGRRRLWCVKEGGNKQE